MTDEYAIAQIPIEYIKVNPHQPRRLFNEEELKELAESIKSVGIIQPPTVRKIHDTHYELIAGERRLRASKLAGLESLPVIVREVCDEYSAESALIENIQRVDLNPIEVALAIKQLMNQHQLNQEDIADKVGKKRSTIANYLRLLGLPKEIQNAIADGSLSIGLAKVILSLPNSADQRLLFDKIIKDSLTVRETEILAAKILGKNERPETTLQTRNFFLEEIAEKLQEKLGTKVEVQARSKYGGRILIDYYSLDDLDRVLEQFNVQDPI